jgi:hypothetical protein
MQTTTAMQDISSAPFRKRRGIFGLKHTARINVLRDMYRGINKVKK